MHAIFLLLLAFGCHPEGPPPIYDTVEIEGRDQKPLYRAKVPKEWEIRKAQAVADTTKALVEIYVKGDADGSIRITFHNFPVDRKEEEIPPLAQIARWKGQFEQLDPISAVTPQAFSGFIGYLFEGSGILNKELKSVMGWAMQLAPEHWQYIPEEPYKQMRASFTLKAVGPHDLMQKQKEKIKAFARSFELIEALPSEL